MPTPAPSFPMM